jgi:hypothetical protein
MEAIVMFVLTIGLPLELASNTTVWVELGTPPVAGPPLDVDQLLALLHELVPVATQ